MLEGIVTVIGGTVDCPVFSFEFEGSVGAPVVLEGMVTTIGDTVVSSGGGGGTVVPPGGFTVQNAHTVTETEVVVVLVVFVVICPADERL